MKKCINICDKCKTETIGKSQYDDAGYKTIRIGLGENYKNGKDFDLCPECQKSLGLINQNNTAKLVSEPTIQEKLFEVIAEIVAEVQEG